MNRFRTCSRLWWLPVPLLACALLQAPATAQTAPDGQALTPEQRRAQRQAQRQATTRADKGPAFAVEIRAPKDIQDVLTRRLELPRFAELPGLDDNELARLLPVARKNAEEILATLGYFSPLVTIEQAPAVAAEPRRVIVSVDPGQPTQVTEVRIDFTGPIATEEGARAQREKIEALWTLRPGMRFTQSEWDAAKLAALRELTTVRYPVGKLASSRADIDPETHSARLSVTLDSGPAFKVGDMVISGLDRHSAELVTRLAQLPPGETYDQTRMLEAQQRLSDSGYFDSVYLSLDTSGGPEATVMRVKVREAKRQKLILGLGVNTDTGLRFSMEHTEHQLPVIGWRAVTKLLYEQPKKSLGTEWTAPPDANLWRWRTSAQVAREESGSFEVDSLLLRAGRTRTTESVDRSYFLQYERARNTGTNPPPDANALSANYVWTRRDFDSRLFPTSGHGLSLDVGGGVTVGDTRYPFGRLVGKWLGYIPLGRPGGQADRNVARGTRIAARAELGAVLANEAANLPTTQLFLTGGDNTVRGYAYRSIGVTLPDGQTAAGRYLVVGSLELQRPIIIDGLTSAWDFVAFVDAGGVADKPQQLTAKVGVGAGAQWNSPIGPLQIDLAWGVATQKLRLNLSMGVLF
ncbi:MAG: outer membrane protein assembly factor [Comamonadaceae bacterium]|nr:outer membrane protein assembly factor [Comamonadaceae bacterium]